MKKISSIAALALLVASASFAQTNQVLSKNAVGYIKMDIPKGLTLAQNPFIALSSPIAISNTFAGLPNSSKIAFWNGSSYNTINRGLSGWGTGGSNVLQRGYAFWVSVPTTAASNSYTVFIMGEVPDSVTAPTTPVSAIPGLNLLGNPYPVADKWTNMPFAKSAPNNSKLALWPSGGSAYVTYNRGLSGWGAATNVTIEPGQGFWVQYPVSFVATNFSVVKPYTWP